jgi:CheY-like chemotaxis protein/effector-binding domain-containing protein
MEIIKTSHKKALHVLGVYADENVHAFKDPNSFFDILQEIVQFARENEISLPQNHMAIYIKEPREEGMKVFVGYPVAKEIVVVDHRFSVLKLPEASALETIHTGDYSGLAEIHKRMHKAIAESTVFLNTFMIEEYLKYSTVEPETYKWETRVSYYTAKEKTEQEVVINSKKKRSVFILEDEEMLSDALSSFLVEYDLEVVVANDGYEAESIIKKRTFDLALLDILVPGKDGFEIFQQLRKKQKDIPIFVLSNLEEESSRKKAEEFGATKYFVKSKTLLSEVAKEISEALDK